MTKPFDLNDLKDKLLASLKAQAMPASKAVLDWTAESCVLSSNAIVKGVGAVLVAVEPTILNEIAKAVGAAPAALVAAADVQAKPAKA